MTISLFPEVPSPAPKGVCYEWGFAYVKVKVWRPPPQMVVFGAPDEHPMIVTRAIPVLVVWFHNETEGLAKLPRDWNVTSVKLKEGLNTSSFYEDLLRFLKIKGEQS